MLELVLGVIGGDGPGQLFKIGVRPAHAEHFHFALSVENKQHERRRTVLAEALGRERRPEGLEFFAFEVSSAATSLARLGHKSRWVGDRQAPRLERPVKNPGAN